MHRHAVVWGIAMALLALAGVLIFTASDARERPLAAPLSTVPLVTGDWTADGLPSGDALAPDPRAGEELMRAYRRGDDVVWVSVAYHPYQADGRRAAARELLVPGHTWSVRDDGRLTIPGSDDGRGPLDATRMVLEAPGRLLAVLYWYQLPGRTAAGEHQYRAWLFYNRLVHRRADAALVRIATPLGRAVDADRAVAAQVDFVRAFHGQLLAVLQRSDEDRGGRR